MAPTRLSVLLMLMFAGVASGTRAQSAPPASADDVVALNEGIYDYLRGVHESDSDLLHAAIDRFTAVLRSDPTDRGALLFRALSHGRLALFIRARKSRERGAAATYKEVLKLREDAAYFRQVQRDRAEAERIAADPKTDASEARVAKAKQAQLDALLRRFEDVKDLTPADTKARRAAARTRSYEFARREREQYQKMLADLAEVIRLSEKPDAIVELVNVVAEANAARIDEQEAVGIKRHEVSREDASGPVGALRAAAADRLRTAAAALEALLETEIDATNLVRTKFFLGVIRYRQGVPLRDEDRERAALDADGLKKLGEAQRWMKELADDATAPWNWRSFGALYLGLILPFRAVYETDAAARGTLLDAAEASLKKAVDLVVEGGSQDPTIPRLVWRQRQVIRDLRGRPAAAAPRNDLSLTLFSGLRYDSNVVLLGDRTDLPRDISRDNDYGFTAGAALDYTLDLSHRLTLGVQARTSQIFNADVDEFDQQTYGGSVALQYELIPESNGTGPTLLALQYDFDYSLLGRKGFLSANALTPSLRFNWAQRRAQTDVFFRYQIRNYSEPLFDRRFNRDGTYLQFGVVHRVKLTEMTGVYEAWGLEPWGDAGDEDFAQDDPDYPKRYFAPFIGGTYSWDSTDGHEFDRKAGGLSTGFDLPLPWGWALDASASFEWEVYADGSLVDFHRRRRRDLVQEYGLALSRTFVLRAGQRMNRYTPTMDRTLMTVRAHATWTDDDSDVVDRLGQAIFSYDRAVYGISVAFTIN